ncbi:MAG: 4'-phosphopantetheinyl transferase family protein [Solirubrobacterales bacterium]
MTDGVQIWRAALDDPGWPGPEKLPAQERERAARFLRAEPARRWVAARWALRRVLGQHLEVPAEAVELEVGEHGKPRLRGRPGPRFNLSHSEGLALVAVAEREVGIDVEAIRPGRDLLALAERALAPDDCAAVRAAAPPQRPAVFYAAWARHEARLKCLGTGLGTPAPAMQVAVETIEVAPQFAAAVAVAGREVGPVDCRTLHAG